MRDLQQARGKSHKKSKNATKFADVPEDGSDMVANKCQHGNKRKDTMNISSS